MPPMQEHAGARKDDAMMLVAFASFVPRCFPHPREKKLGAESSKGGFPSQQPYLRNGGVEGSSRSRNLRKRFSKCCETESPLVTQSSRKCERLGALYLALALKVVCMLIGRDTTTTIDIEISSSNGNPPSLSRFRRPVLFQNVLDPSFGSQRFSSLFRHLFFLFS